MRRILWLDYLHFWIIVMNLTWNFRHFFIGAKHVYGTQNKQSPLFILYSSTYFDHNKLSLVRICDTTMARVEIYLVFISGLEGGMQGSAKDLYWFWWIVMKCSNIFIPCPFFVVTVGNYLPVPKVEVPNLKNSKLCSC